MDLIFCNDCGETFDEDELETVIAETDQGGGEIDVDVFAFCPFCRGFEWERCERA